MTISKRGIFFYPISYVEICSCDPFWNGFLYLIRIPSVFEHHSIYQSIPRVSAGSHSHNYLITKRNYFTS